MVLMRGHSTFLSAVYSWLRQAAVATTRTASVLLATALGAGALDGFFTLTAVASEDPSDGVGLLEDTLAFSVAALIVAGVALARRAASARAEEPHPARRSHPSHKTPHENERSLDAFFQNLPIPYQLLDHQGRILTANQVSLDVLGYAPNELTGRWFGELLTPESRENFQEIFHHLAGKPHQAEYEMLRKDGARFHAFVNWNTQDTEGTPFSQYPCTFVDVTRFKDAQTDIAESNRLETAATLAGGLAHQFNNLMTIILGNAELLRQDMGHGSEGLMFVDQITAATYRANELVAQMIAFARGGKCRSTALDLNTVVCETLCALQDFPRVRNTDDPMALEFEPLLWFVETHAEKLKHVRINLETKPQLWLTEADTSQMRIVLVNFLKNAIEAVLDTPKGGITIITENVPVERHTAPERGLPPGDYVRLAVEDQGCGMDSETMKRVFEPFYSTKFLGRGMGLAAVYGIIKNHGGYTYAHSTPNMGSLFEVYLPAITKKGANARKP